MRKLIFFELNEVPRRIFDLFCAANPQSALTHIRRNCREFLTIAEDQGHLSPWITWPTVHRGVPNTKHTISYLGQDLTEINNAFPPIWDLLNRGGITVGIGGSLHSYPTPHEHGNFLYYLPDTFAWSPKAFPMELEAFQSFNLSMVSRSARNVDTGLGIGAAMGMLPYSRKLGFSARTVKKIASQIISERYKIERKVRRRVVQSTLAFDVILRQIKDKKPQFSTFFTNHVASAMHRFWGASFPEDFEKLEYGDQWIKDFSGEIFYAMQEADYFFSQLLGFMAENPEYMLIVATSMGQGANSGNATKTELLLIDDRKFMHAMGVADGCWSKRLAMVPHYSFKIDDVPSRERFCENLEGLRIQSPTGRVAFEHRGDGVFDVFICANDFDEKNDLIFLNGNNVALDQIGLKPTETDFQQGATGYHIPEGVMFVFDPATSRTSTKQSVVEISTCEIAPSILNHFGISPPTYMSNARHI